MSDSPDTFLNRDYRSRAKRRKLDDGTYEDENKAIKYGHKGQVVPGQLKLDIASCDGGEYQDPNHGMTSWPQNALQDDATVYCTKSSRCNMLLRHASGMPFTLTKMVIKAPRSGYDAPIQEGMIFVAMTDEDILEKTAKYEIQYSPKTFRLHRQRFEHHRPSSAYFNSTRSPLRSIDRTRYLRDPHALSQHIDNDTTLDSAVVPGFTVSIGDPSDEEEAATTSGPPSPRPWHNYDADDSYRPPYLDRYRPRYTDPVNLLDEHNDPSNPTSDSEDLADHVAHVADAAEMVAVLNEMGEHGQEARRILRRTRHDAEAASRRLQEDTDSDAPPQVPVYRRSTPSSRTVRGYGNHEHYVLGPPPPLTQGYERLGSDTEAIAGKPVSEAEATAAAANSLDILAPHARFFIPRSRSSIAVKFDPPVAGRYILIKLWAPCPNANIDIQAITAHGYGGPRFFPGIEMR
ncbi:uncharacterized protein HMPREF1541_04668 [Cyphellophora europaea CBS 101466]|uniref:Uncharacterized protein n=1 Tax=Cyphellophora europaea (strain CBS 101466) TaxID=1220924 RepID=W2RV76_CYPE1|nr:uncharacterized protein HMPREF1541_04668 [Cyphellophora europaea CBS 101466]ETN40391.1 hypothetical protein HMPREF1541_04668 [Cyphellophora europaea CBS 101466]